MKKLSLFILVFVFIVFAIDSYNVPYPPQPGTVIKSSESFANWDSGAVWSSRIVDSLKNKFIRFDAANAHDSVLKYIRIDTIRSNPNIDSMTAMPLIIKGKVFIDTLRGNPFVDSIKASPLIITGRLVSDTIAGTRASATTGIFDSVVVNNGIRATHSIRASDSVVVGLGVRVGHNVVADSIIALSGTVLANTTFPGGNITVDSLIALGGIRTDNYILAGGAVLGNYSTIPNLEHRMVSNNLIQAYNFISGSRDISLETYGYNRLGQYAPYIQMLKLSFISPGSAKDTVYQTGIQSNKILSVYCGIDTASGIRVPSPLPLLKQDSVKIFTAGASSTWFSKVLTIFLIYEK